MLSTDKLCAVVAVPDVKSMQVQVVRALRKTSTVELRLDWLAGDAEITEFLLWLGKTSIGKGATLLATCRRRTAGGKYEGSIPTQIAHLERAIEAGCNWYDLEVESSSVCRPELLHILRRGRRLASAHFFDKLPGNLKAVASALDRNRPAAIKIAAQCDSLAEARRLSSFAQARNDLIAIPMGEIAAPARILALRERHGFAYAPAEAATAPGQTSLDEMQSVYRAEKLNRSTLVYGVIGDPISHSLSPRMHNAAFASGRIDAVYLPFLVRDLKDFVGSIKPLRIAGFSVTIPHKERILKYLDVCDPLAEAIGAVNTVVVRRGKLHGYNTDYVGILRSLERRIRLRGSRVLILGAGGVARAVAFALAEAGAAVCICARRPVKANELARVTRGTAMPRSALCKEFFDAIVNATPVGMHPNSDESPLDGPELNCRLVFDTIYRPRITRLLQLATRRGIETVPGVEMFISQGAAQWEMWTQKRAPVKVMQRAVLLALEHEEEKRPAR